MRTTLTGLLALAAVASALLLAGLAGPRSGEPPSIVVAVSIPPLEGLVKPMVEAAGGKTMVLVPPGASAHGFELPPRAVAGAAQADLLIVVGLGLDTKIEQVARRSGRGGLLRFADVATAPAGHQEHIHEPDADDDAQGHDHDHDHEGHEHHEGDHDHEEDHGDQDGHDHHDHAHDQGDPHLWLNPAHARDLVAAAKDAIAAAAGERKGWNEQRQARLDAAADDLLARIEDLDQRYKAAMDAAPTKTFIVAHDAWGHLAERYGLETVAITGLAAGEPRPEAIARAVKAVQEHSLKAIYREPQMSDAACRRVAEVTGAKVLVLDPLGDGDWFKMMEHNLAALKEGLGERRLPAGPDEAAPPGEAQEPAANRPSR